MIRTTLAVGFLLVSLATAHAATINTVAINRAATATITAATGDLTGSIGALNDQFYGDQYDSGNGSTSAVAFNFGSAQSFNKIFLYQTAGYVVKGFAVQVATVASPDVNNNGDWTTIPGGSFTNQSASGQDIFIFNQTLTSTAVRLLATDKSNIGDNRMRTREVQIFDRYNNVAPLATASYSGPAALNGTASQLTNELISDQAFFNEDPGPGLFDFTWATPQSIGGFMLSGGSGALSEHLTDYKIQADLGGGLVDIFTHTGNTSKTVYDIIPGAPISTTHVRLVVTHGDGGTGFVRVSELYMFVPEPSAGLLLGSGICAMVVARRRGKRI